MAQAQTEEQKSQAEFGKVAPSLYEAIRAETAEQRAAYLHKAGKELAFSIEGLLKFVRALEAEPARKWTADEVNWFLTHGAWYHKAMSNMGDWQIAMRMLENSTRG